MRPLDPRLLRRIRAARLWVLAGAGLGVLAAALVVVQAFLLGDTVSGAVDGRHPEAATALAWLAVVVLARAAVAWASERYGRRWAAEVIADLRSQVTTQLARLGPAALDGDRGPALTTLATRGLDSLDGYLVRYLPQLLLVATLTPAVLAVIWWQDTLAGITVAVTLPLIPLFMALVGLASQSSADRRLRTLQTLGAQVLDLVAGLPTLRALGRDRSQAARVREVGDSYRRVTMATLRSAFLSALVLETLATLSVALVAVGIGLRLVYGDLDLRTGLTVLILAPEVYLPLRALGLHYHASVDGLAAADQALTLLDEPVRPLPRALAAAGTGVGSGARAGTGVNSGVGSGAEREPAPDLRRATLHLRGVGVRHPGRDLPAPDGLDLDVAPGEVVALAGPSGVGKSTAVQVLLGLRAADVGRVTLTTDTGRELELSGLDGASWFAQVAWTPQRPVLLPGTLAENLRLTHPGADDADLDAAAAAAGLDEVVAELPDGWATRVGHGGHGLSAGQRQRLALARTLVRPAALVVLDEPTAHLDAGTEERVHAALRHLRDRGRTVVLVAHRPALAALADRVVTLAPAQRPPATPVAVGTPG